MTKSEKGILLLAGIILLFLFGFNIKLTFKVSSEESPVLLEPPPIQLDPPKK